MITDPAYVCEPWRVRETRLQLDVLAQSESVFALANGHLGWRGNLDEGEPHGVPGSYLNGYYELRPLPYAEGGYGYPESDQAIVNVTNGKIIRLLVGDEPFDLRYGRLHAHQRILDLRSGLLSREADWTSPAGKRVRIRTTRLVSLTQRAVGAIRFEVEPVDGPARVVVQSELVANEPVPATSGDPRVAAALDAPLVAEQDHAHGSHLCLIHHTRVSGLRVGVAADHHIHAPVHAATSVESDPDLSRFTLTCVLAAGQRVRVDKTVAYGWSGHRSLPAVRDQVDAALAAAQDSGWSRLVDDQRSFLDEFWSRTDVEVDGDPQLQQAVRFGLFHVLQAGARAEERGVPAKGLTGPGYDGHSFWDTETFVLPLVTHTTPRAAQDVLRWRHSTLPEARARAAQLGLRGAAFAWRTIAGAECSGYWPAGVAAFHLNAAIADAVVRYVRVAADSDFERGVGAELLVETARLWESLGYHGLDGRFHIDGVTGPDEYSAIADDNVYTNLMAQANLRAAADVARRHVQVAERLGVDDAERERWRAAAEAMAVPYDDDLKVHQQAAGFTRQAVWPFDTTGPDRYPLMLHFPYFDLYRKQVVKQADLVLAMYLCGAAFGDEDKARNFAYYEALTVRDSSLSAPCQAVIAAETGHTDLAYDYLRETALLDLADLQHNTRDGLHIAALAGSWTALIAGFGGLRHDTGTLCFAPRLPTQLSRLAFRLHYRHRALHIEITPGQARYELLDGRPLTLEHHRTSFTLARGDTVTHPIPPPISVPRPNQPSGREPNPRSDSA
ncbi:glycoside hydrolase family 65 protein [Nocardia nova]